MELLDLGQYLLLGTVIAGITELLTRLRARDYWVALTIAISAATGALFGFFGIENIPSVVHGAAIGFGLSGSMTILGHFGNKSVAKPTDLVK